MVKKAEYDLVRAEVDDLREKLEQLLNYQGVKEAIKEEVDKVNGDILDKPVPEGLNIRRNQVDSDASFLSNLDDKVNVIVNEPDSQRVKDDDPVDILVKKGASIFGVDITFNRKDVKRKNVKSCSHCGSIMEKGTIEDQMKLFDKKIEEVNVKSEQ